MPRKTNKDENKDAPVRLHEASGYLAGMIQDSGFRQIVPPPVEQKENLLKLLSGSREVSKEYVHIERTLEAGEIMAPTQIFNAYRIYQALIHDQDPRVVKWFYIAPVISADKQGEYIFRHELGVFVFGKNSPMAVSQLINMAVQIFTGSEEEVACELNNVGCDSCVEQYQEILESHFVGNSDKLCDSCTVSLSQSVRNVLSCGNKECKESLMKAPQIVDFLDEECREHLVGVLEILDETETPYVLNPTLYTDPLHERVVFRLGKTEDESVPPLISGGDYSGILKKFDEEAQPAAGFVCYVEDLLEHISIDGASPVKQTDVFVISLGDQGSRKALSIYKELRQAGIKAAESMLGNSGIRDQLREAKKLDPTLALIIGQKEALDDTVLLRDMKSSMQETFTTDKVLEEVRKRLGE